MIPFLRGLCAGLVLGLLFVLPLSAATSLPRSSPEEQGVSSADILKFVVDAEKKIDALHSFMLIRHGRVVAEGWWTPYSPASPHELASLSKSFTSTAVGLAVAEGKLSISDPVLSFFPALAPKEVSPHLKAMRVHDLLIMATGHEVVPALWDISDSWTQYFLAQSVPYKPGTHFMYDSAGSYMLSAIVQKATGQTVRDYLMPRLFEPLGIDQPEWQASPEGVSAGGWGLSLRTEDIAKFGQLYLQKGKWQGRQLIPSAWVEAATSRQTSNGSNPDSDWEQGYGYQFWRCRHGFYRGDGAHGQYCIVMPDQDAVLAITAGTDDMQGVLNVVWDHFVPALRAGVLPPNAAAQKELAHKLQGLSLPAVPAVVPKPHVTAAMGRTYVFPSNSETLEAFTLTPASGDATTLTWRFKGKDQVATCRPGVWIKGRQIYGPFPERPWAASGAWTADDTYTAKLCAYETGYVLTLTLKFAGDELYYDATYNLGSKLPQLIGKAHAEGVSP